ncbi:MAG TPA: hypothetical protein VLT16_11880 [Candidatus Limnocylindrales bacterium]|nr:hypothetical protein [Candidatus Limnocylindrales bacterium]
MDPFAKKMWRAGALFAGLMIFLFAVLTAVWFHIHPSCPDRTLSHAVSPGRQWTAAILQRRCGDESPFITQVNIRPGSGPFARGFFSGQAMQGNVFTVEQDAAGAGVSLTWTAGNRLLVHCPRCNPAYVRRTEPRLGPVQITYEMGGR